MARRKRKSLGNATVCKLSSDAMETTLFHGTHLTALTAHAGQCWTDDEIAATTYADSGRGALYQVVVDLSTLNVLTVADYDRNADDAPGDRRASLAAHVASGADVVVYQDEDESGRTHETVRLVSARAVEMVAAAMCEVEIG